MNKIEKALENIKRIYDSSPDEVKESIRIYIQSIGENSKPKPTLDDYTTIKTYEDACEVLGLTPILSENRNKVLCAQFPDHYDFRQNMPKHIIALMKLETISRALWGRNFQPKPDGEGNDVYWYPRFALWTKKEIEDMNSEKRGALLSADASYRAIAGFGCLFADVRSSRVSATAGFRLCQETEEKAEYFGKQFIELWAEYLKFNFEVGERLKKPERNQ